jgi:hypothetical protein
VTTEREPRWRDELTRDEHFRKHRRKLRLRTVAEYERSALETIRAGVRFEYFDPPANRWRVGYYDLLAGRFTALDEDELEIETHFAAPESYVRNLVRSTYPP